MELKPGYKQTEVGVIPEDWSTARLSALVERGSPITYGVVKPGSNDLDGVLFIRGGDIFAGKIEERQLRRIPKAVSEQYKRTLLEGGEILVSLVGYPGEAAIVPSHLRGANIARQVALVRLSTQLQIFPDYVCKFLQSDLGKRQLLKEAIGSAQQVINLRDIQKVAAVIPPTTSEQRAIAEALSDADVLIESLDQLITKKRQIKQGVMQELLTGKRRLSGFSGEWEVKTFDELFAFSGGYSASRDQLSTEGYCYLHYGDIHGATKTSVDTHVDYQNIPKLKIPLKQVSPNSLLKDGDVVFVDASEDDEGTSRHVVVVNKGNVPFISGLHTIVAKSKTNELVNEYRKYCFQTPSIRQQFLFYAVGTKVSGISKANISKLTLPIPSVPEQTAIATLLSDMDTEIAALESGLAKARQIKQGMMQELLTGRIRLL